MNKIIFLIWVFKVSPNLINLKMPRYLIKIIDQKRLTNFKKTIMLGLKIKFFIVVEYNTEHSHQMLLALFFGMENICLVVGIFFFTKNFFYEKM